MQQLKITLIQSSIHWQDIDGNIELFQKKIESIDHQTDVIVLPEMFSTGFTMEPARFAEKSDGKAIRWMKNAADQKSALVIASIAFTENNKYFNRLFAIHPGGKIDCYDKRHLFSMAGENKNYKPGNEKIIVEYKLWKIRPLICYDLRFPAWSRNLDDYDVLVYIANWPVTRNMHWKVLLQARAIENQCYVIGVNRVGEDGKGNAYTGDSMAFDPMGNLLTTILPGAEQTETIELDKQLIQKIRTSLPFLNDRDKIVIV